MDFGETELMNLEKIKMRCIECGDCLIWTGSVNKTGNIPMWEKGSLRRKIYIFDRPNLKLDSKTVVSMSCNRSKCLNPEHMFHQLKSDVLKKVCQKPDIKLRRQAKSTVISRALQAKISIEIAREIRASTENNQILAAKYGIHHSLVSLVRLGKAWKESANPWEGLMR